MRVHVVGAAGYAAGEFIRLVAHHPQLALGLLESSSQAGNETGAVHPELRALPRRFDPSGSVAAAVESDEVVALCGDAALARELAPALLARGARVVDFSDAFRAGGELGAVYGWVERYRDALRGARLIANPGCYPTAALLGLAPLAALAQRPLQFVVDAKSGITGAGRTPKQDLLFAEADGEVRAYGLAGHRHGPEIERELAALGAAAPLLFTPHVVPLRRGLLADCYAFYAEAPVVGAVQAAFARAYDGSPFVRVLAADRAPSLRAVAGTNDAEISVGVAGRIVRVLVALDNLGKGAAGQALQALNVMLGFPEESGLVDRAVVV
ncbi:MAG: N-acetyl-gamma-glutamyl-phosphate reductase [Vulcanimicrobiaceae bacterium]